MITSNISDIAKQLGEGSVIAYPTETVFGIGCLPSNEDAIKKLLAIKQRSPSKGLILLAGQLDQLEPFIAPLTEAEIALIEQPRTRATSWVVPAKNGLTQLLTGGRDTIAIRITQHPFVRELCQQCGQAIISTSANISGEPPTKNASELAPELVEQLDILVDEACLDDEKPSQIIDLKTQRILRD